MYDEESENEVGTWDGEKIEFLLCSDEYEYGETP